MKRDRVSTTEEVAMKVENGTAEQTHITAHVGKTESTRCKEIVLEQTRNIHKPIVEGLLKTGYVSH